MGEVQPLTTAALFMLPRSGTFGSCQLCVLIRTLFKETCRTAISALFQKHGSICIILIFGFRRLGYETQASSDI